MKYPLLLPILFLTACATEYEPMYMDGKTHGELKEEGFDFWQRNADHWWAQPVVIYNGLREI